MRRLSVWALVLALLLCRHAAGAEAADNPAKRLEGRSLIVAMSPDFMYFETISKTEECGYEGLDIDILKSLSQKLGFTFTISPMPFAALIGALQEGKADFVISGMSATAKRAELVDFSDVYAKTGLGVVVPIGSDIDSLDDLKGKVICCSEGTSQADFVSEEIEGAKLVTCQGQSALGLMVANGERGVQAGITSSNGAKKLASTILDAQKTPMLRYFLLNDNSLTAEVYNIAFPKGSALLPVINDALKGMIASGEMSRLVTKWLY